MDKSAILELVVRKLQDQMTTNTQGLDRVRQGAIDAPGAMQSKSDTTKVELGRVADQLLEVIDKRRREADALREFAAGMKSGICTAIGVGALAYIEIDGTEEQTFFFLPAAAGMHLEVDGLSVQVVSMDAPFTRNLLGRRAGETITVPISRGVTRTYYIISII